MKSLGRTIDKILKVAPALEPKLTSIKSKWKRYPDRSMVYWKELASTLTSDVVDEMDREKIKSILATKSRQTKPIYTFEEVGPNDKILGALPENLADRIKHHDLISIRMAMLQTKAALTRDRDLIVYLTKRAAHTEVAMKKIWIDLKDHFMLWDKDIKVALKKQGSLLVLIDDSTPQPPTPIGENGFMMRVDPETLRGFFRMLGIEPPTGLF
jgi:hypothetical protein